MEWCQWYYLGMRSDLNDQAYAVLTVIALHGSATAYEIEQTLDRFAGEFWSTPHTQVYRECTRLAAAGLVREKQETSGRRRRVYSLTKTGRDTISEWVRTPTERSIEVRDLSQLKLLASEFSTTEDVRRLAEAQIAVYRRRLSVLSKVEEHFGKRPELALRLLPVAMGRAVYEAALGFWTGIAKKPPKI